MREVMRRALLSEPLAHAYSQLFIVGLTAKEVETPARHSRGGNFQGCHRPGSFYMDTARHAGDQAVTSRTKM